MSEDPAKAGLHVYPKNNNVCIKAFSEKAERTR